MANRKQSAPTTKSALINKILANPQFPAYVQTLEPQVLNKLVQRVGKEDAQALLTHATDIQIRDLIETDTWCSNNPGEEEAFDPAKFLEWLELWIDMGPDFLTAKLKALGSELFAFTLQRFVVVVDLDEIGVSGAVDTFHNFGVMPKSDAEWPLILRLLIEAWDEDATFLEECLARCCQRRSLVVEKTYITDNESLEFDVAGNRDRHRREQGYVTSVSAAAFLTQARDNAMNQLLIEVAYDPLTSVHLRQASLRSAVDSGNAPSIHSESNSATPEPATATAEEAWQELNLLVSALTTEAESPAARLLLGSDTDSELYLKRQLRILELQNPQALVARQNEIIYLANILMEGVSIQSRRMSELEAAQCANATVNLGLMFCVFEEAWDDEQAILNSMLLEAPGLIKAFRVGYHLLCQIPPQIMVALQQELTTPYARRRLRREPWIQQLVTDSLHGLDQGPWIYSGVIHRVDTILEAMSLIADNTICQQLSILNNELPCFPESLDANTAASFHVDSRWRFIETPADLQRLQAYLGNLHGLLF